MTDKHCTAEPVCPCIRGLPGRSHEQEAAIAGLVKALRLMMNIYDAGERRIGRGARERADSALAAARAAGLVRE